MGGWRRGARGQRVKQVGMRGRRDAGWGAEASPWTPQGLSSLAAYVAAPWGACGSPCMSRRAVLFRSRCTSRSCLFDPLFDAVDAACLWWGVRLGPDPSGRSYRLLTGAPCWRHGQHPYAKDARAEITRVRRSLGAWDSFSVGAGWGVQGWSACRSGASVRRCAHSRSLRASVRCACRRLGAASARFWPPLRSSWSLSQRARAASSTHRCRGRRFPLWCRRRGVLLVVSRGALPVAEPTPCTKGACGGAATLGAFAPSAESTRRRRVVDTWEFVLDWCVREKVYRVGVIGPAVLCTSLRHAPGPTSRSLIRACAGPRPTSRSRRPLRSLWGSRSASALLRALSPGGCPGRRARRVPSASEHEATREKVCNCRLLGPAAPDHGVPVHGAAAPGARGSVCCVPALLGLLAPDLDAPAGHSTRGAFPLLFLPLWRRHRGMLLVVARGASPVVGPAPYA